MSGILGIWNLDGHCVEQAVLARLSTALAHRGPDGEGRWSQGPVGLAARLFRVTPEALSETQPLVHPSGAVLVFDGRLDNRGELLATLKAGSPISATSPDPVLVLAAYDAFGDTFPERLNGDFACGLFDPNRRQLLLVRDAMGIRPLYYCHAGDLFLFASEIKALLSHPRIATRPNADALAEFLVRRLRQDQQGFTFFEGILSVPPAYVVSVTPQGVSMRRYWDFDPTRRIRLGSFQEYAEGFLHYFEQAVGRRLRSAFPVAVSVSGGLDSSSIFCLGQALRQRDAVHYPSLIGVSQTSVDGSPSDEKAFLDEIEKAYGITIERLRTRPMGPLEGSREEVWHVELPILDEQWGNTSTLREASYKFGARVLLTGQWGDNMLVDQAYLIDLFHSLDWGTVVTHLREYSRWNMDVSPAFFWRRFFIDLLKHHVPDAIHPLLRRLRSQLGRGRVGRSWYAEPFQRMAGRSMVRQNGRRDFFATVHAKSLYKEARNAHNVLAMEWNNKACAMHGLEVAFPFLDRDLVAYLMAIPGKVQSCGGVPKSILRQGMRGVLPNGILERRGKADFTDLINDGMARDFSHLVHCLQSDGLAVRWGYVIPNISDELIRVKERIRGKDCMITWALSGLLGLELWLQVFFGDKNKRGVLMHADEKDSAAEQPGTENPPKKAYRPPQLVEYGDLRSLTGAKGGTRGDATPPGGKTKV